MPADPKSRDRITLQQSMDGRTSYPQVVCDLLQGQNLCRFNLCAVIWHSLFFVDLHGQNLFVWPAGPPFLGKPVV